MRAGNANICGLSDAARAGRWFWWIVAELGADFTALGIKL